MKRTMCIVSAVAIALIASGAWAEQPAPASRGGLIPPPAISMPFGGRIVTDINMSDGDVLGIIKQLIPAIGEVVGSAGPLAAKSPTDAAAMAAAASLDFSGLSEAVSGVKNVRVVAAVYGRKLDQDGLLKDLDRGVVKIGKFSRVLSDFALMPGVMALYCQADNGGYIGYAYDSRGRVLYAARVVGFVDIPKFTKWATDVAKALAKAASQPKPTEEPAEPAPEPASPAPAQTAPEAD